MKMIGQNIGPQQTLDYTDEKIEPQQRGPFVNCVFFFFNKNYNCLLSPQKTGERKLTSFCFVYALYQGAYLLFKRIVWLWQAWIFKIIYLGD